MTLIKWLIGLPLLVVLVVFAFINNDLATFDLWPFYVKIDVSLSVAIVFLFAAGFFFGTLFSWLSYLPRLRAEKKQNKKLNKAQQKLAEKVSGLQDNINTMQVNEPAVNKKTLKEKIKNLCKRKNC